MDKNDRELRYSNETFYRSATDGTSLLWHRRNSACVTFKEAESYLRHIDWRNRKEHKVIQEIAAELGMKSNEIENDFHAIITPLIEYGLIEVSDASGRDLSVGNRHSKQVISDYTDVEEMEDWASQIHSFFSRNNIPQELHIDITAACTERCVHCYLPDYPLTHLSFEQIQKALREFRDIQGLTVQLTGGECMLHPDFERICLLCRECNLNFVILSNLTLCDSSRVAFLKEVQPQFINVSLYSMNPSEHDSITRLSGSWQKTMTAICACERAGLHVRIAAPLLKENRNSMRALARFAQEHHMHFVPDVEIVPKCDHDCTNIDHACSSDELYGALAENRDLFDKNWDKGMPALASKVCDIGMTRLYLNSKGDYYPCGSMHGYVLGNISTDSMESVWKGERMQFLRNLTNRDFQQCAQCANRPYCMVCPAFNFNATGDMFKTTPAKCAIAKTIRSIYG